MTRFASLFAFGLAALAPSVARGADEVRVVVLDDGERIARDRQRPLPPAAWPEGSLVRLFALRAETVAFQVVLEPERALTGVHLTPEPLTMADGHPLGEHIDVAGERFLEVARPSGNEKEPGSLAFEADAAPPRADTTGTLAEPLVPGDVAILPGQRGALWVDLDVPSEAPPGVYRARYHVSADSGAVGAIEVEVRVLDATLPYAALKTMVYYEPKNLMRRMGSVSAEPSLRQLMHAHHLSSFRERNDDQDLALDERALSGELFSEAAGYVGPGRGVGEGVFALGAYGGLGAPSLEGLRQVERMTRRVGEAGVGRPLDLFLYAVDEDCGSTWGRDWKKLLARPAGQRPLLVGVTCGRDPIEQAADLVMMTPRDYFPARVRVARRGGKRVWAYNGQRPYSGPLMLDVPPTDLRANAWIAARYGIERWFYWESTYWFDDNRGGRGGALGFDPFVHAETFHNADGDYANQDGLLIYPGTQVTPGMRDFETSALFPSIRLKNLRRGIEDFGYIELARAVDPVETAGIVRRMVPRALAEASQRPSWPSRGIAWLAARSDLARVITRGRARPGPDGVAPSTPDAFDTVEAGGCAFSFDARSRTRGLALVFLAALSVGLLARRRRRCGRG